jgi:hypothetical protein
VITSHVWETSYLPIHNQTRFNTIDGFRVHFLSSSVSSANDKGCQRNHQHRVRFHASSLEICQKLLTIMVCLISLHLSKKMSWPPP